MVVMMRKTLRSGALMSAFVMGCHCGCLAAQNPGDQVVVLYNKNLPDSKKVADYYAEKRLVPKAQVWGFSVTPHEEMTRADFREHLQKPLAKLLQDQKLWRIS